MRFRQRMTARVLPPIGDPKEMPDPIELDVGDLRSGGKAHVIEGALL